MNRARRPPLQHPLAPVFDRAIDSFSAALSPETTRHYRGTARNFLSYLGADHPELNRLDQLRREPHLLGWMSRLRSQVRPLSTASYINQLIALRSLFNDWLGRTSVLPSLT
jgi:Phage integrase, N-terminal SAM-like domain